MKFKYLIIIFLMLLNIASVSAVTGVQQTDRFWSNQGYTNPVTHVQEIIYTCSDSTCSSQGDLVLNKNTGNSNELTFEYPYNPSSTKNNPDYYSHFSFATCYLPKEYKEWVWGYGANVKYDYHMRKARSCHSPIDSFNLTNRNYVNEPVVVEMIADFKAETQSAFTDQQLGWFPAGYEDYYSAETKVTLEILNADDQIVYTDYVNLNILMDTSENIHFEWIPEVEGVYTARITTEVTDCQCSSSLEEHAEKKFTVWAERPKDQCYTIINNLKASPKFSKQGDLITISFDKISNYADDNYNKTAVPTRVDYEIRLNSDIVLSNSSVLDANPNSIEPVEFSFQWIPSSGGLFIISVTGIAENPLCTGKTNPLDTSTISYYVEGTEEKYLATFIVKDSETKLGLENAEVTIGLEKGKTNNFGEISFKLSKGSYNWNVSKQGYETKTGSIELNKDEIINIELDKIEVLTDTKAPEIELIKPEDGYDTKNTKIEFIYKVNDTSDIKHCSLIINGNLKETSMTVEKNIEQNFTVELKKGEDYNWKVRCMDEFDNIGESETRTFEIKDRDKKKTKSHKFLGLVFECEPLWECGDWSACYEGIKTRECRDLNNCGTSINKPVESVGCQEEIIKPAPERSINKLELLMGTLVALILILFLVLFLNRKYFVD